MSLEPQTIVTCSSLTTVSCPADYVMIILKADNAAPAYDSQGCSYRYF